MDEGSFKYVMSGSLLGIELKEIASAPVGYLTILRMYPMDFEEFMIVNNVSTTMLDMLKEKFIFTMLDKELKFNRYENSFLWLKDAGVALPVYNVDAPVIPLLELELINKNGEVNNGAHFENAVAQQLTANGFEPYFCKKKNLGELDFAIEMNGKVVPIEVKSGKSYKSHKALNNFMNVTNYHLEKAYIFSTSNIETEGNITYLPIYMCYLLKEQELGQMIVELDTAGL